MSEELKEWTLNYFRYRKSAMGEDYEIVDTGKGKVELRHKDSTELVLCAESLSRPGKFSGKLTIVTLNKKPNVEFLTKNWKDFCIPNLRIYFTDPKNPHQKWVISPLLHSKICEDGNLKASLKSMSEAATQVE